MDEEGQFVLVTHTRKQSSFQNNVNIELEKGWIINFVYGHVTYARWINRGGPSWLTKYVKDESNYVRAVRSSIGEIR